MATPKQKVLLIVQMAQSVRVRVMGKQCWLIRIGHQGSPISDVCATRRAAWKNALDRITSADKREVA